MEGKLEAPSSSSEQEKSGARQQSCTSRLSTLRKSDRRRRGAWAVFDRLNRIKPNPSPTPKWSDKPLLKSYEKSKPPLGWPRTTDSLCPKCVPEIRQQILDGQLPHEILLNEKVGEIKARSSSATARS